MDPREVLEREAQDALTEAKARVRAAVEAATAEVLAGIGPATRRALATEARATSQPRKSSATRRRAKPGNLLTRTEATREFGVTTSVMRTMERHGEVHARRKGGRIMLDRDEVAAALKAKGHVVDLTAEAAPSSAE